MTTQIPDPHRQIKFIILLAMSVIVLLSVMSCQKEPIEPVCKTCDVNVKYWNDNTGNTYYIESSKTYCDGSWTAVDGDVEIRSGTMNGVKFKKTSTTVCR